MPNFDIVARLKLAGEQFSAEFNQRMAQIERQAESVSGRVARAFGGMATSANAFVAGIGAATIAAAAQRALEYASSLGEVSQQLGVTTRGLQTYRYAASQAGISQQEMDTALQKFTKTLGDAKSGSEQAAKVFRALGFTDEEIRRLDVEDALLRTADGIGKIEDRASRATPEVRLFGRAGQQLDVLLSGGSQAINELADEAERLGLVLSDEQIQRADETADKLAALQQQLEARIAGVVADNAAAILALAGAIGSLAQQAQQAAGPMDGFIRIVQNGYRTGGLSGALIAGGRSFLGDGSDQQLASTPRGFAALKTQEYRDAANRYVRLRDSRADAAAVQDALNRAKLRRQAAVDAVREADAYEAALKRNTAAPPAGGGTLAGLLAGKGGEKKAGKSDAEREAEAAAKAQERLSEQLDRQIASGEEALRIERMRTAGMERQADIEDAIQSVRDRYPEIVGKTVEQVAATLKISKEQAQLDIDRVKALEAQAVASAQERHAQDDASEAARKRREIEEDAVREAERQRREELRRAEEQYRDLADFFYDAFDSRGGDIWDSFKRAGKEVIASLAAQWVLAMSAGKPFDLSNAASLALGQSSLGSLAQATGLLGKGTSLAGLGGLLGLGGSSAGIVAASPTLSTLAAGGNIFAAGGGAAAAGAAGGAAGAGGLMAGLSAAAPYLAIAAVALPLIGGLLGSKPKAGSSIISGGANGLSVIGTQGNNKANLRQSGQDAASAIGMFQSILDQLGAGYTGTPLVSIGRRGDSYRVDPQGRGFTKLKYGTLDFGEDQQAAIMAAVRDMLSDVTLTGISEAAKRVLNSGQDLDAALQKAVTIESIPKLLKARLDPLGAAIEELNGRWEKTVAILKEAGATAEQVADAQKLYGMELADVKANTASAAQSMKDFLDSLKVGSGSPYSLRDQEAAARAQLDPYLGAIDRGERIDQERYLAAAQSFLDVERQLYGSTAAYFAEFDKIREATAKAIATVENVTPFVPKDPFAEATATSTAATAAATQATAEQLGAVTAQLSQATGLLAGIQRALAAAGAPSLATSKQLYA